jgi:hypothetical protein
MSSMKTAAAVVILALCATSARAQLVDDCLGARQNLADAGYRYDDPASLVRALEDKNDLVVTFATTFLARQRATPEIVAALRTAGNSPREWVAAAAFGALQELGATGWEGSAIALMHETKTAQYALAGVLARAGRSEGWFIIRDALTPDNSSMGVASHNAAFFHGLKMADGTTIDAIAEIRRVLGELTLRGRSVQASTIEVDIVIAEWWSRRARERAR